jgi:hypothetical protein
VLAFEAALIRRARVGHGARITADSADANAVVGTELSIHVAQRYAGASALGAIVRATISIFLASPVEAGAAGPPTVQVAEVAVEVAAAVVAVRILIAVRSTDALVGTECPTAKPPPVAIAAARAQLPAEAGRGLVFRDIADIAVGTIAVILAVVRADPTGVPELILCQAQGPATVVRAVAVAIAAVLVRRGTLLAAFSLRRQPPDVPEQTPGHE